MKIECAKETLLKGIQAVQNVVSARSALPILSNMLLETQKDKLRLIATDLEIGIWCVVPVSIIEPGAITIPAKKFSDIIKELPDNNISLSVKKNNVMMVDCQKILFKLIGLPKDDFPKLPEFSNEDFVTIKQSTLKEMLNATAFAISHDEARYVLNGALLTIKPNLVRVVTTDGRRLAMIERDIQAPKTVDKTVIIPLKAVNELLRSLRDEGDAKIMFAQNQIAFDLDGIMIISRLIEGEFPNYQQVIPKESDNKIKVNTQRLLSAVRRVAILTSQDFQGIKIDVLRTKLVLSKNIPDVGEARDEVEVEYKGQELSLGFNPAYLVDVLRNINKEDLELEINGADKPVVFRTQDKYLYLALPMQL